VIGGIVQDEQRGIVRADVFLCAQRKDVFARLLGQTINVDADFGGWFGVVFTHGSWPLLRATGEK
jgi:hypothetical protein